MNMKVINKTESNPTKIKAQDMKDGEIATYLGNKIMRLKAGHVGHLEGFLILNGNETGEGTNSYQDSFNEVVELLSFGESITVEFSNK